MLTLSWMYPAQQGEADDERCLCHLEDRQQSSEPSDTGRERDHCTRQTEGAPEIFFQKGALSLSLWNNLNTDIFTFYLTTISAFLSAFCSVSQ